MILGTVKWFNHEKGYGFIETDDSKDPEDVFLHITVLEKTGIRHLTEGTKVKFIAEIKDGRLRAIKVNLADNLQVICIHCGAAITA